MAIYCLSSSERNDLLSKVIILNKMESIQSNDSKIKVSLDETVNNESLRQDFLTQLDLGIPYCSGIIYDPEGTQSKTFFLDLSYNLGITNKKILQQLDQLPKKKDYYTQIPLAPHFFLLNKKFPLFIGAKFFNGEFNKEEVSHALVTHEGRHLEQLAIGFPYFDNISLKESWIKGEINPRVIGCIAELDADYNSLLSIQKNEFQVRDGYKARILDRYKLGLTNLYGFDHSSKNKKEKGIIRKVLESVPHEKK